MTCLWMVMKCNLDQCPCPSFHHFYSVIMTPPMSCMLLNAYINANHCIRKMCLSRLTKSQFLARLISFTFTQLYPFSLQVTRDAKIKALKSGIVYCMKTFTTWIVLWYMQHSVWLNKWLKFDIFWVQKFYYQNVTKATFSFWIIVIMEADKYFFKVIFTMFWHS